MCAAGQVQDRIRAFLRRFHKPGPLLVAISGGSDSTALLVALSHLIGEADFRGFSLQAITIDHGLRLGSAEEAQAVARLCQRHGIPHRIRRWDGEKPVTGIQAAARAARYRLLADEASESGAMAVLTGHSADDQRETIAMRAARGAGEGLSGMAEQTLIEETVWLLRPLLSLDRQTLRAALSEWGETWLEDPSNDNPRFERVRLRIRGVGTAEVPDRDRASASARQAAWLDQQVTVTAGAVAQVSLPPSFETDENALTALFRLSAVIGGKAHLPQAEARLRLAAWLAAGAPGRKTLGGTVFDRRREALYLYRENRGLAAERLTAGGDLYDGRYLLCGPAGGEALIRPAADRARCEALLVAGGVPAAIAKRAAPALVEVVGATPPFRLERRIAAQRHFLSGFDLKVAESLRRHFGVPGLPDLPLGSS